MLFLCLQHRIYDDFARLLCAKFELLNLPLMHYFLISIIIVIDLENIVRHRRPHVPFLPTRVNLLLFRTRVLFCLKAI